MIKHTPDCFDSDCAWIELRLAMPKSGKSKAAKKQKRRKGGSDEKNNDSKAAGDKADSKTVSAATGDGQKSDVSDTDPEDNSIVFLREDMLQLYADAGAQTVDHALHEVSALVLRNGAETLFAQAVRNEIRSYLDRTCSEAAKRAQHRRDCRIQAADLLHDDSRLWSPPCNAALLLDSPSASILDLPGKPSLLKWLHAIGMHEVYPQLLLRQRDYCYRRAEDTIDDLVLSAEKKAKLWFEIAQVHLCSVHVAERCSCSSCENRR